VTATETRTTPLIDVLSVTSGMQLSDDGGKGLFELLSWLTDQPDLTSFGMALVGPRCTKMLLEQFPELVGLLPPEKGGEEDLDAWIGEQILKHGKFREVSRATTEWVRA
jgi:hypothetical protein